MSLTVGILEDHPLMREALSAALQVEDVEVAVRASQPAEFLSALEQRPVDVGLIDLSLGTSDASEGIALVARLAEHHPSMRNVVLTAHSAPEVVTAAMEAGASIFLSKAHASPDEVLAMVRAAARGERCVSTALLSDSGGVNAAQPVSSSRRELDRLTPREREVLACVGVGFDNLKIAALLGVSERTVKAHVSSLYRKLDLENRVELALRARRFGLPLPRGRESVGRADH